MADTVEILPVGRTKKLIVLCDGTWKNSDSGWKDPTVIPWEPNGHLDIPSNVLRIGQAILPEDEHEHSQVVFYQAGVGTGWSLADKYIGGGTGAGLSENIREAYTFIANNYSPGDSIFLVGFSRGSFTARSVAGLIGDLGLLQKHALPYFYEIFKDWENTGKKGYRLRMPKEYPDFTVVAPPEQQDKYLHEYKNELERLKLTREVQITAVGVWDTVGTLGIPTLPLLQKIGFPTAFVEYKFTNTRINNHVLNAFQALALDERRFTFAPTLWEKLDDCTTNLKQVWFPGSHSNIGGGFADTNIADLTLAWMMSQLSPWLSFEPTYLATQHRLNQIFEQTQKPPRNPRGWAMGKLYESVSFTYSLFGSGPRTPGLYHRMDYRTGKTLAQALHDTNESVHASVRTRIEGKGLDVEDKPRPYAAAALKGWVWDGEGREWKYQGSDAAGAGKVMPEDRLSDMERQLVEMDKVAAEVVAGK